MTDTALHAACLRHMPQVTGYHDALCALGIWWQKVTLIGKINSLSVAHTLIDDMQATRHRFEELQVGLIDTLVKENVRKLDLEFGARAQAAIDTLVRNLFERTADVGFLATDDDIRAFLRAPESSSAQSDAIVERLREYTAKYSVYDQIIVLDATGRVRAQLDAAHPVAHSSDPLIGETLAGTAPYVETFRRSDLQPHRRTAHIFSARITDGDGPAAAVLGVLCLCFRFENEMRGIFAHLARPGETIAILDRNGQVIASSDEGLLPFGQRVDAHGGASIGLMHHRNEPFLSRTCTGRDYQGYAGLAWQGHIMRQLQNTFPAAVANEAAQAWLQRSRVFSEELRAISRNAALVTDDLTLVVLNGQIVSAKRDAAEFMPVLEEIRNIGNRTKGVFDDSIANLYSTVVASLLSEVQFQALLAIDIMDRNLYERANDVRWWALTSRFRASLAAPGRSSGDDAALAEVLAYINGLYTVYTNLLLFDAEGRIVAVSDERARDLVGRSMPDAAAVRAALAVRDAQRYAVSPFDASPLYAGRHTYLYLTAVRAPDNTRVVGGIAVVFDAEPQFAAMLDDFLPRDDGGEVLAGAFGLFTERSGRVIASTRADLPPGTTLALASSFFGLENGAQDSAVLEYEGHHYAVGAAMSRGYREYKTTGDYTNDVLALIFAPV